MVRGIRMCVSHARDREAAETQKREAADAAEKAHGAQRQFDRDEVIKLAKSLGERGMPGAKALRLRAWPLPKTKVYLIGVQRGESDAGNGHWGDQGASSFKDDVYISGVGEFFFVNPSGNLHGPIGADMLDTRKSKYGSGYKLEFDFGEALRVLRRADSAPLRR